MVTSLSQQFIYKITSEERGDFSEVLIFNNVLVCHAELVSASRKTLKRVQGDNKTSIVTAFWAFIAGLRKYFMFGF